MSPPHFRTLRYARAWMLGPTRLIEEQITLDREGTAVPATLVRPDGARQPLPGWVVLHGITRQGRAHPQLLRFTRAIASSGAVAIVPEVPEWRAFELAPRLALPTLKVAIAGLAASGWARDAPVGVIGFSFGAPHAIAATAHPEVRDRSAGSVAFGGYCDLERTIRFLMTGEHEWAGRSHRLVPDPYGRWIVAASYLTRVPGHAGATDVSSALRELAARASDMGVPSIDARLDPHKAELRTSVAAQRQGLFDLFAPASARLPPAGEATAMAEALAGAAKATDAAVEPSSGLAEVTRPVHVVHGRHDHLIPFSEGLRLQAALPAATWSRATITRLFGHSSQDASPSPARTLRELPSFFRALRGVLRLV